MRESKPEFQISSINTESRIAVIVAKWNASFNDEMYASAIEALQGSGVQDIMRFDVPGAFEMPVLCLHLAETEKYDAIICLGTIIRGATYHFEIVANESARGIMDVMLATGIPIINGILTCNSSEEAEIRASRQREDKGRELALSCVETLNLINTL